MARKTKTIAALAKIRERRQTDDGKACIEVAEAMLARLPSGATQIETLAEARQWIKLGLEHDRAKDSALLHQLRERLNRKSDRSAAAAKMRGGSLEVVQGGAS